ncbi:MAG: Trm112 family protein [candidate division Zixibacteria bacterium]|nr:Trm112 family protein [candidate division Zixibacteria bacterium]
MELSKDLLEKLVCPKCKGKLESQNDGNCLVCDNCRLEFRVVDNVPVLLIDEARKL